MKEGGGARSASTDRAPSVRVSRARDIDISIIIAIATVTSRDPYGFEKFVPHKEVSSSPSPSSIQILRYHFIYTTGTLSLYLHLFDPCLLDAQPLILEQLSKTLHLRLG